MQLKGLIEREPSDTPQKRRPGRGIIVLVDPRDLPPVTHAWQ
jgi:hypothetical protein